VGSKLRGTATSATSRRSFGLSASKTGNRPRRARWLSVPAAISGAEIRREGRVGASYPGNSTGSEGASRLAIRWKITWLTFSPVRLPSMPTVDTTAIVSRSPGR
jgi:hypothetical protein